MSLCKLISFDSFLVRFSDFEKQVEPTRYGTLFHADFHVDFIFDILCSVSLTSLVESDFKVLVYVRERPMTVKICSHFTFLHTR